MLPFTAEQFFDVFGAYNGAIWPVPLVAYGVGLAALAFLVTPGATADRVTSGALSVMWLWTGVAYHWLHFAAINPAALLFGAGFVAQGLVFAYAGYAQRLAFGRVAGTRGTVGLALLFYSIVTYPLAGVFLGHVYPRVPTFGVTPCPVTIFALGCLLLSARQVPWWVTAIPVLWSFIGGSAAFLLNLPQDWMLLVSGIAALVLLPARALQERCPEAERVADHANGGAVIRAESAPSS
jgi:hypothetical protein